MSFITDVNSP
jgi:hypothetical protein